MDKSSLSKFSMKLPVGINGGDLITVDFNGSNYVAMISLSNKIKLFSDTPINPACQQYGLYYVLELDFNQVSDIYREKLYAKYNNTVYEVGIVGKNYSKIELIARPDFKNEDLKLGFVDDREFLITHKFVSKDDVSDIVSERYSIYAELLKKNNLMK